MEIRSAFEAVIGLEVHVQLRTHTKLFSGDEVTFGAEPNTCIDPVTVGLPGALPVLNREAITLAMRMGLAVGCAIAPVTVFARKHYFYPDLPRGYQISQYEQPICIHGKVDVPTDEGGIRSISVERIHLEEDAGKSVHDASPVATLLDYNRCGTALIEMVSGPDFRSPGEAARYMQYVQQLVRYLGVGDGNMEEGSLRCDANVSIRPQGCSTLGTKTEIKNMNSFRHVEHAIAHEIERQIALVQSGGRVVQETRLWDPNAGVTRSMRSKEEAHDYRYMPDPDLVPTVIPRAWVDAERAAMPELPRARFARYQEELGLPPYDATVLTEERAMADYFEATLEAAPSIPPKKVANFVMTSVMAYLNASGETSCPVSPSALGALLTMRHAELLSSTGAQALFDALVAQPDAQPESLARSLNLVQVSGADALAPVVEAVLRDHPAEVERYRGGQRQLIGFFVGQVMKRFSGSPNPKEVKTLLEQHLNA